MKSQVPKVLHSHQRLHAHRARLADGRAPGAGQHHAGRRPWRRRGQARRSSTAHQDLQFVDAGTAARHRPRAAADARRCSKARAGTRRAAVRRRAAAHAATLQSLLATHPTAAAAATVITADDAPAVRLRPHRPHQRPHLEDRRGARRLAGADGDHRDQLRHLRVRSGAAVRRARLNRHREQAGRVLPARIWSRSIASRSAPSPPGRSSARTRFAASTAAPNLQRSAPWFASRRTKS